MTSKDAARRRQVVTQAVGEEYEKLGRSFIDRRRVVMIDDEQTYEGGFGLVKKAKLYASARVPGWLAEWKDGPPRLVAAKRIKFSRGADKAAVKRAFTREVLVWSGFSHHPCICDFLGFSADIDSAEAWLFSSWEPNGNVAEFVRKRNLQVPEQLSLVYDTIEALTFLHQLNPPICHGDIKSANVVVSASCRARFCDFGLARLYDDCNFHQLESTTRAQGSVRWCAPEVLNNGPRTAASDIYSWAWLTWEIMTGELPYEGMTADYAIICKIFEGARPEIEGKSRLSECLLLWDLMNRCWVSDPLERPSAAMCNVVVSDLPRCIPTLATAGDGSLSPELLMSLGVLESWKGNVAKSLEHLSQAQRMYDETQDLCGVAEALLRQADVLHAYCHFEQSCTAAAMAVKHFKCFDDPRGVANATYWLAKSLLMLDKNEQALSVARGVVDEVRQRLGDDLCTARCICVLGSALRCLGRSKDALDVLGDALAMHSRIGNRLGMAQTLEDTGFAHLGRGDRVAAAAAFADGCEIARSLGWPYDSCEILAWLADIKVDEMGYSEAEELLLEAIPIGRSRGLRWELANALKVLGRCYQQQGRLTEAAEALEEAYPMFQGMVWNDAQVVAWQLANLKRADAKWDSALLWNARSKLPINYPGFREDETIRLTWRGNVLSKLGRWDEAALNYEAALHYASSRTVILMGLASIPKTFSKCSPSSCNIRQVLNRRPQRLVTGHLKLRIPSTTSTPEPSCSRSTPPSEPESELD